MDELKLERVVDLEIGQEVQYQNAIYKIVHKDDKVYLEFCRNKFEGYPFVYDMDALVTEVFNND